MALVASGGWSVNYLFKDNNGKFASCGVDYSGSLTEAEVTTSAGALGAALQAISNAALVSYTILKQWVESAPITPVAESEVERKLRFSLGTAQRPNVSSIEVPSPVFTIEVPNTDAVNPSNALVVTLAGLLTEGLTLPGNGPVTYYGADITRAENPVIIHRNRRPRQ